MNFLFNNKLNFIQKKINSEVLIASEKFFKKFNIPEIKCS